MHSLNLLQDHYQSNNFDSVTSAYLGALRRPRGIHPVMQPRESRRRTTEWSSVQVGGGTKALLEWVFRPKPAGISEAALFRAQRLAALLGVRRCAGEGRDGGAAREPRVARLRGDRRWTLGWRWRRRVSLEGRRGWERFVLLPGHTWGGLRREETRGMDAENLSFITTEPAVN